jgi:hypothetical protein
VVFSVDPSTTPGACTVSDTNGTTVSYTGTGSCVIDANRAGGGDYPAAAQVQQAITISPAPLNITASSPTMIIGSAVQAITASYTGFVNGDNPASLTTQPTCTTTATSTSPAGTYPTTCTGAAAPTTPSPPPPERSPSPTASAASPPL